MNIEFNRMLSLNINGKAIKEMSLGNEPIFPPIDFKTLKLDLGSSFHILGIADGVVAGYTISGDTYTLKTYNLNTGSLLTSFDITFGSNTTWRKVKAFWAEHPVYGKEFVFGYSYAADMMGTISWYWYFKHSDGSSVWNGFSNGMDLGCAYDSSSGSYKCFAVNYSGKNLTVGGVDLSTGSSGTFSYSYTVNNQYVTQIQAIQVSGQMVILKCDNTNLSSNPNLYGVLWNCSNYITTNIWSNVAFVDSWTDYGTNDGCFLMLGSGIYYLFKNIDLISPFSINTAYTVIKNGVDNNKVYLYKSSENAIYKLENGTYTKLGDAVSGSGTSMLDNTRKYRADLSTGKIYYFPA